MGKRIPPRALGSLMAALVVALAPAVVRAEQITVFAAASLRTALEEIAADWQISSGHQATLSFAGSAVLARQIAAGAPADVFISANAAWMDWLEGQGRIEANSRADLLGNRLVLIGPAGAAAVSLSPDLPLAQMLDGGRLAMALIEAVPAGIYGKAALAHYGLWDVAQPHVVQADNVRAALAYVASGAAPLGIVYASDAMAEPRVAVLAQFPPESHLAIRYPAARVSGSSAAATAFLAYLRSAPARSAFERNAFEVLP